MIEIIRLKNGRPAGATVYRSLDRTVAVFSRHLPAVNGTNKADWLKQELIENHGRFETVLGCRQGYTIRFTDVETFDPTHDYPFNVITAVTPLITIRPFTVAALGNPPQCALCGSCHVCDIDGGGMGCIVCGQVYVPVQHGCCLETKKEASAG